MYVHKHIGLGVQSKSVTWWSGEIDFEGLVGPSLNPSGNPLIPILRANLNRFNKHWDGQPSKLLHRHSFDYEFSHRPKQKELSRLLHPARNTWHLASPGILLGIGNGISVVQAWVSDAFYFCLAIGKLHDELTENKNEPKKRHLCLNNIPATNFCHRRNRAKDLAPNT